MKLPIVVHEAADAEINEAAAFYDIESHGLGDSFLDEIAKSLDQIVEFPESATLLTDTVRKKVLANFPYSVLYDICRQQIRVLAIAHHKRRPFYWHSRE